MPLAQTGNRILRGCLADAALRRSFNALAAMAFELDFEPWYQNGFSTADYEPWSVVSAAGEVLSNVSVNHMRGLLGGRPRHYIQLGTVMTRPDCRGLGLNRRLMEAVLRQYARCDGFFLYANDSVLDYYPKFGFAPAEEKRYAVAAAPHGEVRRHPAAKPVPMQTGADWQAFLQAPRRERSLLRLKNDGLLMFYLSQSMQSCVYDLPGQNLRAVAEREGGVLTLYALYELEPCAARRRTFRWQALAEAFGPGVARVELAFPPEEAKGMAAHPHKAEETTLFLKGDAIAADLARFGAFPELMHA